MDTGLTTIDEHIGQIARVADALRGAGLLA